MREIVEYLAKEGFIYKEFKSFDKSLLKTRRVVDIYNATDTKGYYHLIFSYKQKGRFLLKHAEEMLLSGSRVAEILEHNFKYKHLVLKGAICSKSENYLKLNGWKIYNDIV